MKIITKDDVGIKDTALRVIREMVTERGLEIDKILFFGSRARGNYYQDSDWDFLVISNKDLAFSDKHRLITQSKRKLAQLRIPNDIIIQSKTKFDSLKNYPGCISYTTNLEGVPA